MTPPPLLTEAAAASILGISVRTMRRIRHAGGILYVRISRRRIGYRPQDVEDYLDRQSRRDTPHRPAPGKPEPPRRGKVVPFSQMA